MTSPALIGVFAQLDEWFSAENFDSALSYGLMPTASLLAYRLSLRSHTAAIDVYRRTAADADARLHIERAEFVAERVRWETERTRLIQRIHDIESTDDDGEG